MQIHYALKAQGYKVIAAAKRSFNLGIADFAVKLRNIEIRAGKIAVPPAPTIFVGRFERLAL